MDTTREPIYFGTAAEFRAWLEANHASETELLVGLYKKGAPLQGISYKEAVDEALCFGWIDGIGRRVDEHRFSQRFTPRTKRSTWSKVNLRRVEELKSLGRMHPAGLRVYEGRDETRANLYSFEQEAIELPDEYLAQLRAHEAAWAFFQARPPSYQRAAKWWVVSAKREETRRRRLATLIEDSANGVLLKHLRPYPR